jgi:hypothetical protein
MQEVWGRYWNVHEPLSLEKFFSLIFGSINTNIYTDTPHAINSQYVFGQHQAVTKFTFIFSSSAVLPYIG